MPNETDIWWMWSNLSEDYKAVLCGDKDLPWPEVRVCLEREYAQLPKDQPDEDVYKHYHDVLMTYIPPILLILGTFGNVLSFIILTRRPMRRVSTYLYLAVLSVMDTLVLQVGLLRLWIGTLTGVEIKNLASWVCKSVTALGYTVSDYSVWLILAVTVERYIAVNHPLKAHSMCNTRKATRVIVCVGTVIFAVNFHFFFTVGLQQSKDRSHHVSKGNNTTEIPMVCEANAGFEELMQYWQWVDAFLYSFLPFLILIVLNGRIIYKVMKAKASRDRMSGTGSTRSRSMVVHYCGETKVLSSPREAKVQSSSQEGSTRLTVMLLTISFAFLITTLPVNVLMILSNYWNSQMDGMSPEEKKHVVSRGLLLQTVTQLLMYTNHAMNFYLYCAAGQKFRQELCRLIRKRPRPGLSISAAATHRNTIHTRGIKNGLTLKSLTPEGPSAVTDESRSLKCKYSPIQRHL